MARKRAEEEAYRLALEVAEAQHRAEEARTRAEDEARKRAEIEEERRKAEEEEDRLRAEESIRIQAEGEEARKRATEDANRLAREIAEAQQRAEEAGSRAEDEARKRAEAEGARERAEEEARKLSLEMEELLHRAEESRRRSEEEAAKRAELEEQRRRDDEVRREREAQAVQAAQAAHVIQDASMTLLDSPVTQSQSSFQQSAHASQSIADETVLTASQRVGQPEASSKRFPFADSVPAPVAPRSYTVPIVLGSVAVLIVLLIAGAAVLYSSSTTTPATPEASPGNTPGGISQPAAVKQEMIKIDGATFRMGLDEKPTENPYDLVQYPAHSVSVRTFWMNKTEVTNAEYAEFVNQTKYTAPKDWIDGKPPSGQEQWPVTNVSLDDAKAFADWRSKRDTLKYRLPSEEEWEFAARNGQQGTLYPWGNEWLDGRANVEANSVRPVGSYPQGASSGGVLDLIGNAWEWTSTQAVPYPGAIVEIPAGMVIIRGGNFGDSAQGQKSITATRRSWVSPNHKQAGLGFRLVRE